MKPLHRSGTAVGAGVLASAMIGLAACGFGNLFSSAGPRDVRITFVGDTSLFVGDTSAFSISVTADGVPIPSPSLSLVSSDTSIFTLNSGRDSLFAIGNGNAHLTAQLNDRAFTDSMPTISVRIKVRGGP